MDHSVLPNLSAQPGDRSAALPIRNEIASLLAGLTEQSVMTFLTVEGQNRFVVIDIAAMATKQPTIPAKQSSPWTDCFWVPHRGETVRVNVTDITLITAERDYMRLHVAGGSYLMHETIAALEQKLDPAEFIRLHRSTIVRRGHIVGFKYDVSGVWSATLADGQMVRVGRTYLANARAIVGR
jgi:two-component system response regulator AlgR